MPRAIHEQWRDRHEVSRYPFADGASLITTSGLDFGRDTLLDAVVHPIGGAERMHVSRVRSSVHEVTIFVGTQLSPDLCSAEFDPLSPPDVLRLEDSHGRAAGLLVSESTRLARFQSWDPGDHLFEESASEFAASTCVPTPEVGLRGLLTPDGDLLAGDLWLVGENGVVLREQTTGVPPGARVIRVDVVGDPLFRRALCDGDLQTPSGTEPLFASKNFLKTFNGLPPDAYGDFKITTGDNDKADNVLRVIVSAEGIRFEAAGERTIQ